MNNIRNSGGTFFTDEDIKKYGMDYIMDKAFEIASNGTEGVHISYDLDSIDPTICPGVSVPELGGLTYEEAMCAIKKIKSNIDKVGYVFDPFASSWYEDSEAREFRSHVIQFLNKR